MESAKGTTTESNSNQNERKKAKKEEGAVKKVSKGSVKSKHATRNFKENYTGAK